jgi:multidrug efflux pump
MVIITDWPGASAEEMMREVTDRIERKLEELPYLDNTESYSEPGHSVITVSLRGDTPASAVPDAWYQVRKKIGDITPSFPDGVRGPFFNDEFKDVFGIVYVITGDDFSRPDLKHVAETIREEFLTVSGAGKITLLGVQDERIYIDLSYRELAQLRLSAQDIFAAVQRNNVVAESGFIDTKHNRIFVRATGALSSPDALASIPVEVRGHLIPLGDIASIYRGVVDPPVSTLRFNGKSALGIAISMQEGGNILDLGRALDKKAAQIVSTMLPAGLHMRKLSDQAEVVAKDVEEFEEAFLAALAIVLLVSFISLGWRTGMVVAISVPLVLAGVLVGMRLIGIDLQRISLGAMVIALGLLVDDAIIAVETMLVKLEQGWDRLSAGGFAYTSTAFPMLTGTLVTVAGYLPVGLAQSLTGEYTRDIFLVVGMALILSWFVAILFVPYLGSLIITRPRRVVEGSVYNNAIYAGFRRIVLWCVRRRWIVISASTGAFALSALGFMSVPRQFFPSSDRLELMVDVRLAEASSFAASVAEAAKIEDLLSKDGGVQNWAVYTGVGSPRFFLASQPRLENANFAQFMINMKTIADRDRLLNELETLADSGTFPDVRLRPFRLELGPPVGYPVQFRIMGPDPATLRSIAAKVRRVMYDNPHVRNISANWGNQGKAVEVQIDQNKVRLLKLSSADIAATLQTLEQGVIITQYREGTDLIPVVARAIAPEREDLAGLADAIVAATDGHAVPLSQIVRITYGLEAPTFWRRNRSPMLVIRADIAGGLLPSAVTAQIIPQLAEIRRALPEGYRIETGGSVEETAKGQASVSRIVPLMLLVMLALLMAQLRSFWRVALVLLSVPPGLIGVASALLATGAPFGFVAMLGFIALAGIIMRNSVILVDQIERNVSNGLPADEAIVEAAVRRARPILLTAAAAILGLIPLSFSIFWGPMAIAIMGGLLTATVLTLCFVPALYSAGLAIGITLNVMTDRLKSYAGAFPDMKRDDPIRGAPHCGTRLGGDRSISQERSLFPEIAPPMP